MMNKIFAIAILMSICVCFKVSSQIHLEQNGLYTSVTNTLSASGTQAKRYEIATVGYNSHHWQFGGLIIIELFEHYYGTGYEKYIVEIGYQRGTGSTSPKLKLVESEGMFHLAKLFIGIPYDLGTTYNGYPNLGVPIYLDVGNYSKYKARITYSRNRTDEVTQKDQIKINVSPTSEDIADFAVSTDINNTNDIISTGNLKISGNGDHYIENGNIGIGTTSPDYKLDVEGTIRAHEIKVNLDEGADFVFEENYNLMPLNELETFVKTQKHLPEVAPAKEMEAEGLTISEMNIKLLQKIEELTLYVIDMNKEFQSLKEDNKILQKKINVIETKKQ